MRKIILYILLFFIFCKISVNTAAQTAPQKPDFAIRFGTNSSNYGQGVWDVHIDNAGNTYAGGNFNGTSNFNPSGTAISLTAFSLYADGYAAKYNSSGIAQWVIPFTTQNTGGASTNNSNYVSGITTDATGNVYVTGYFWGTVDFDPSSSINNLTSTGSTDIFVAKYNSNGQYQWAHRVGGSGIDVGLKIRIDGNGNVFVVGYFSSTSMQANTTGNGASITLTNTGNNGTNDAFVLKYSAAGAFQHAISFGSTSKDNANDLAIDGNNNLFVTGSFAGTVSMNNLSMTSNGNTDAYLLKTNNDLTAQFLFNVGGTSGDNAETLIIDGNNDVIIAGNVSGVAGTNFDMNPSPTLVNNITLAVNAVEVFVAKYANDGSYKWAIAMSGSALHNSRPLGLGTDACNNVVLGGAFTGTVNFNPAGSGGSFTSPSSWGSAVAKFSEAGNFMWGFMTTASSVSAYRLAYNKTINKFAIGGDLITNTTYPNADFDPTGSTKNLSSFNATYGAAMLALYPDPGNVIPTITLGSVAGVSTLATSFDLPYTATTGGANQFTVTTATPATMSGFTTVNNSSFNTSPMNVAIPASAANTYNFNMTVRNSTTGCVSVNNPFTVTVNASASAPAITSFTPLSAKPGDEVTITGINFNAIATDNVVFLGATRASVTAATTTSLTVTVPTGATYAPITLLNAGNGLMAYSLKNFTPVFSPAKTGITSTDFSDKVDFTSGSAPFSAAIADLDGDGKPDMVVTNYLSSSVSIYRNNSTNGSIDAGSFSTKVDFATGFTPFSVTIGDLDGDGKPDLAVINSGSNTISVFHNTSTRGVIDANSFAPEVSFATGRNPDLAAIGDLNGDGKPDLAVTNFSSNTVSILRNTATTGVMNANSFAAKVDFTSGASPLGIAMGDLDEDGKPDLAITNFSGNTISILRNNITQGSIVAGSFEPKVDFTTGLTPRSIVLGDLDGDGKLDLAVGNQGSATISVLRNTTTSGRIDLNSFANKVDFTASTSISSLTIGDLDGDGKPDLATTSSTKNTVSLLRNTSSIGSIDAGSFAAKTDFKTGGNPRFVAIGDLDGDGKPDLAVANGSPNTVSVLRNAASPSLQPTLLTSGTPAAFETCINKASNADSLTVSGTGLSAAVNITAPQGYEISITRNSGFGGTISLTPSNGSVANTKVYVRLNSSMGGNMGGNISFVSTGAITLNVALTGVVNTITQPIITTTTPTTFCSGSKVVLTSSVTTGNQWLNNGVIIAGATNTNFTATDGGVYSVIATGNNGCAATSASTTVAVNELPAATITQGINVTLASNGSVTLTANTGTGFTYQWFNGNTSLGAVTALNTYAVNQIGAYAVQVTNAAGCSAISAPTNVTVLPTPTVSGSTTFCSGGSVDLSVGLGANQTFIKWKDANGNTVSSNAVFTATATGNYAAEINTAGGIETTQAISIKVLALPTVAINTVAQNIVCAGTPVPLTAIGATTYQWLLNGHAITTGATLAVMSGGSYTVKGTDANGCFANSNSQQITINSIPSVTIGSIASVTSNAASFTIPVTSIDNSPDRFSLVATTPTIMSGFAALNNQPYGSGPINVPFPASASNTYNFNLTVSNSNTGCVSSAIPVSVVINSPVINTSGTITSLTTSYGTPSAATSFMVGGTNLESEITISAPTGFELSTTSDFSANTDTAISLKAISGIVSNTTIYARLMATSVVGTYNGNISINSIGAVATSVTLLNSTVTPKTLTIAGLLAVNRVYNGTAGTVLNGTPLLTGVLPVDANSVVLGGTALAMFNNSNVGAGIPVTVTGYTISGIAANNYTLVQPAGLTANITPAPLTVTANVVNKIYGTTLTGTAGSTAFTVIGLQNSETMTSVTIAYGPGYAINTAVGTYIGSIMPGEATGGTFAASNYTITYVAGNIVVAQAPLTIIANAQSKVYGAAASISETAFTAIGLISGDAVNSVSLNSAAAAPTATIGAYPIIASAATGTGLSNYSIDYTDGIFSVTPAALTVTANNQVKCEGELFTIPGSSYSVSGLLNRDAVNSVSFASTGSAVSATSAGSPYLITPSIAIGIGLSNYSITYVNGSFTVNSLPIVSAVSNFAEVSKGTSVSLTATSTGTVASYAWSPAANLSTPTSSITNARVIQNTVYTVTVTTIQGCMGTGSVTVNAKDDLYVEPINVFSPNGDGINDRFVIKNLDQYPNNKLQVFDRTGKIIYEQNNYANTWNGTVGGQLLTKDTYFYVLTIRGQIVKRGTITLVR